MFCCVFNDKITRIKEKVTKEKKLLIVKQILFVSTL